MAKQVKTCVLTAIVRPLWSGEASDWPPDRSVGKVQHSVLLFEAPPRLVFGVFLENLSGFKPVVVFIRIAIGHPTFGEDKYVWPRTEGIRVDSDRSEVDVTVVARCLVGC